MRDLDFIVPSALVGVELAPEILSGISLPYLLRVLARAGASGVWRLPDDAPLTTWQGWLFGHRAGVPVDDVNVGELWAMAAGRAPARDGGRWVVEPAHFQIARDHLRLTDPVALAVTLAEARALADVVEPVLAGDGWTLEPVDPATLTHWFVSRSDGLPLSGAAIDRAVGDNVATWQPRVAGDAGHAVSRTDGAVDAALAWRRCVNEIQMLWFGHPVNDARGAEGRPAINTLWLSGNGRVRTALPRYARVDSKLPLVAALPIESGAPRAVETFDRFVEPARRDDWGAWRDELTRLDARIGNVLREQAAREIGVVTFAFCGRDVVKHATLAPGDVAKFWRGWTRRPSLVDWFAEEPAS